MQPSKPQKAARYHVSIFVVTHSGKVIGQLRDDKPGLANAGMVGLFGGGVEVGETVAGAADRELREETNLAVLAKFELTDFLSDVIDSKQIGEPVERHFYYARVPDEVLPKLEVYEGQGWVELAGLDDQRFIESFRPAYEQLLETLANLSLEKSETQSYS